MNTEKETIDRLLELGAGLTGAANTPAVDGDPYLVIPSGCKLENLAHLYPPTRIRQHVRLDDAASFAQYVGYFKTDATQIFADLERANFTAVLDYHTLNHPAYGNHRASLVLRQTPEFITWMEKDCQKMSQLDFATWLEDAQAHFRDPSGADLLELITSLHGHVDARFNMAFRLKDGGCNLAYDEDVTIRGSLANNTKPGEMALPDKIVVGLSPFEGSPLYEVNARLKVRIQSHALVLWFETLNKERILRDAVLQVRNQITTATSIEILLGTPNSNG